MVSSRLLRLVTALSIGVLLGAPGRLHSAQDTWAVARMSGSATIALPGAPAQPLLPGMFVPLGSRISTAASGRVLLQRGTTTMMVSPATVIEVIDGAGMMRVVERRGTIELEVEKRGAPYFSVETPMLSAVVKGTRFTVTSTARGNAVAVDRGLVQVTDRASGQSADVPAGRAAATSREAGGGLAIGSAAAVDRSTGQLNAGSASRPASSPSAASTSTSSSTTSTTSTTERGTSSSGGGSSSQGGSGASTQEAKSSGAGTPSSSGSSRGSESSSSRESSTAPSGGAGAASGNGSSGSGGANEDEKGLNQGGGGSKKSDGDHSERRSKNGDRNERGDHD